MKIVINNTKNIMKKYKKIILIGLFLSMPLISKNFILGHDSLYHLSNIESMIYALKKLNLTEISPLIANGFGYGGTIFYPKLPHFILAVISIIILPFNLSSKTAISIGNILIIILSSIAMCKLLYLLFNNKKVMLIGSCIYITMPYFISDIFVRSALNETCIYLFMPLVLIGLIYLSKGERKKFYIYFILGYIGMLGSHLVMSVYFTFLMFVYIIANLKKYLNKENFKHLFFSSMIILIIFLPKAILLIQHKNLNIYGVFDANLMGSTVENVKNFSITLKSVLIPDIYSGGINYFINIFVIVISIFAIIFLLFKEKQKDTKQNLNSIVIILCISIFLSTKFFPYQYIPDLFLSIQFACRNHIFTCFTMSIIFSYGMSILYQYKSNIIKIIPYVTMISSILCAVLIINNAPYTKNVSYDTIAGMGFQKEYLTKQALKNIEYIKNRQQGIKIISKNTKAKVKVIKDDVPYLKFTIAGLKEKERLELELPRLYYLGYEIILTSKEKEQTIKYENNKNGFIKIIVPENGTVEIKYTGTAIYQIFSWVRNIAILIIILVCFKLKRNNRIKSL